MKTSYNAIEILKESLEKII